MLTILQATLPVFIAIAIGYLAVKWKKYDLRFLINLLVYIAMPSLVLTSFIDQAIILTEHIKIWATVLIIILGTGVTSYVIFQLTKQKHSGLYVPIMIMNVTNLGLPVVYLAFGQGGLQLAVLFSVPVTVVLYTLGIFIFKKKSWKRNLLEIFKTPLLYAVAIGLSLNLMQASVPTVFVDIIRFLGQTAVPLALIVLSGTLVGLKIKSYSTTILASLVRMGVGLGLGILCVRIFDFKDAVATIIILLSAMPAAVFTSTLAAKYKNEDKLVSSVVLVTTLLSIITIPLILKFFS